MEQQCAGLSPGLGQGPRGRGQQRQGPRTPSWQCWRRQLVSSGCHGTGITSLPRDQEEQAGASLAPHSLSGGRPSPPVGLAEEAVTSQGVPAPCGLVLVWKGHVHCALALSKEQNKKAGSVTVLLCSSRAASLSLGAGGFQLKDV